MKLASKTLILPTVVVDFYLEKLTALHDLLLKEEVPVGTMLELLNHATQATIKKTLSKHLSLITETGFFEDIKSWENWTVQWTDELRFLYLFEAFTPSLIRTLALESMEGTRDITGLVERYRDIYDIRVAAAMQEIMKDVPEGASARLQPVMEEICKVNIAEMIGTTSYNIWKVLNYAVSKEADILGLAPLLAKLNPLPFMEA